jgi:adenine phosphoribosyltransferase
VPSSERGDRARIERLVLDHLRTIPDFPEPGIAFRDITPLLADGTAFRAVSEYWAQAVRDSGADFVVGIEARGFIVAAPAAALAGVGFVPLRKPGKLPGVTISESYALEYGQATLEMHEDAIKPGSRVVIMDDVLATGGTAHAAAALMERAGGEVVNLMFLMELDGLDGRAMIGPRPIDVLARV